MITILRLLYRCLVNTRLYWLFRLVGYKQKSRAEVQQYWRQPGDDFNRPGEYTKGVEKSYFLARLVGNYIKAGSILELGCNVGRNLNCLYIYGYKNLTGVDISPAATKLLTEQYPEMAKSATIYTAPIETIIEDFDDEAFDVVFTMAVFEHIHKDSEWIFPEVARIARKILITIENERWYSWRHFPRNYQKVFEPLGMRQLRSADCNGDTDFGGYTARVFAKGVQ